MISDQPLINNSREPNEGSFIRCYRYMCDYWRDAICNSRLKLSAASEFNDVFDCSGTCKGSFSESVIKNHIRDIQFIVPSSMNFAGYGGFIPTLKREYSVCVARSFLDKTLFALPQILCFAAPETKDADSLMWSHYADKWKGVRLGFDLLFENHLPVTYNTTSPYLLSRIVYSNKRPTLDLSRIEDITEDPLYGQYYYQMLQTKSSAWSYESEWRLFCDTKYSSENGGLRFWDFHRLLLRTIDLGPQIEQSEEKWIVDFAQREYPHAEIRKIVMSDTDYDFSYRTIVLPQKEARAELAYQIQNL